VLVDFDAADTDLFLGAPFPARPLCDKACKHLLIYQVAGV